MTDLQHFTHEEILRAAKEAIPQYGGANGKLRLLGFPAINIGEGACIMASEVWLEGPKDALCVLSFIERTQVYTGHGNVETETLPIAKHETAIPDAVFEEVWHRACARYEGEGGTISVPSA